jgi:hypothetical protein
MAGLLEFVLTLSMGMRSIAIIMIVAFLPFQAGRLGVLFALPGPETF